MSWLSELSIVYDKVYRNEDFVVSTKSTAFDYYPYTFDTSSNDGVTTFRNKIS